MSDVTIAEFAQVLKIPAEKLLTQLNEAGIGVKTPNDVINDDAKRQLLTHLRRAHLSETDNATARNPTPTPVSRLRAIMERGKLICVVCRKEFIPAILLADPFFQWNCAKFFRSRNEYVGKPEIGFKAIWPNVSGIALEQLLWGTCSKRCLKKRFPPAIRDPL